MTVGNNQAIDESQTRYPRAMRIAHGIAAQRNDMLADQSMTAIAIVCQDASIGVNRENHEHMMIAHGDHVWRRTGVRKFEPGGGPV